MPSKKRQNAGSKGGRALVRKRGKKHMRAIGRRGGQTVAGLVKQAYGCAREKAKRLRRRRS